MRKIPDTEDLGRHHELVGELTELTGEYPLRERLRGF
jgi:Bacterial transcriptional activator domain